MQVKAKRAVEAGTPGHRFAIVAGLHCVVISHRYLGGRVLASRRHIMLKCPVTTGTIDPDEEYHCLISLKRQSQ